jgi:antitoxin ParD1/3/4
MPTRNVNLTDHFDRFILEQVSSGHYQNASEVMRAGLGLLEQHEQEEKHKLTLLRQLAAEGFRALDQGRGIELDEDRELQAVVESVGCRAANRDS